MKRTEKTPRTDPTCRVVNVKNEQTAGKAGHRVVLERKSIYGTTPSYDPSVALASSSQSVATAARTTRTAVRRPGATPPPRHWNGGCLSPSLSSSGFDPRCQGAYCVVHSAQCIVHGAWVHEYMGAWVLRGNMLPTLFSSSMHDVLAPYLVHRATRRARPPSRPPLHLDSRRQALFRSPRRIPHTEPIDHALSPRNVTA
jgi:hypothetical protein